jgi:hypothetical protein
VSRPEEWLWWTRNVENAKPINWEPLRQFAIRACEVLITFNERVQAEARARRAAEAAADLDEDDTSVRGAAALLGVSLGASADEVRAALRRKLGASRLHPDQGGDGEHAKRLIAAKNLLVERARGQS